MYNNYSQVNFMKFLNSIRIDLRPVFPGPIPELCYSNRYLQQEEQIRIERVERDFPDQVSIDLWELCFNDNVHSSFFNWYNYHENNMMNEMSVNLDTIDDNDEFETFNNNLCDWFNQKASGIKYDLELNRFQCDFEYIGETFNKVTFKESYNDDILIFYRTLKEKIFITYRNVINKIPSSSFKPNLKWEKNDVDLLELITALIENEAISTRVNKGRTHRNEVIKQFEQIFGFELKDSESKLSKATLRDKNSKFLLSLQDSFQKYAVKKLK